MIKKTIYLAVMFAAAPSFAATSLEQLESGADASMQEIQVGIPAAAAAPADEAGYTKTIGEFEKYRQSKLNGIKNEDNLPFILVHGAKTRKTVLMIHGLTDSPWYMRELGEILYRQGYNVVSVLLPGHGTKPEDLTTATKAEWRKEVDRGLGIAAGLGEQVSLAGFSTGGALSLDALRRHPRLKADKLFLFSPALAINESEQTSVFLGCQSLWLTTKIKGDYKEPAETAEVSPYNYTKMAINGVCQLNELIGDNNDGRAEILDSLRAAGTPVFAVESEADATVSPAAVTGFMAELPAASGSVYVRYQQAEGIAHAAVTRPETNPRFVELSRRLAEFAAAN